MLKTNATTTKYKLNEFTSVTEIDLEEEQQAML